MHLDNINKGPGRTKLLHDKGNKKKITCYACGREGHMKRDCRSQGKVVRQLNVLHRAAPNNNPEEAWNVISRPATINIQGTQRDLVNGLDDLTIMQPEEFSSDEKTSKLESLEDLEATEIDQTKFGKMAKFQGNH
jgi:hypothetical protein